MPASLSHQVVITDFITGPLGPEQSILGDIAAIVALDAYSEADLVGRIEDADAIMLYHNLALSRTTIERLRNCRLIVRCGVGYDNVDRAFARQRGIAVCNVPDYGTEEVADSAIGMFLSLARGISFYNSLLQHSSEYDMEPTDVAAYSPDRGWMYTHAVPLYRLRGRTFGILGLGRIGTATAIRAKALGMNVLFYDPYVLDGVDKSLGIRRAETLSALLRQSHALSVHCPLSSETRHIIDASAIAQLPRGAYLINTARGAIVNTAAIPDAIASGQLAGAAIDVLDGEPPRNDNPLLVAWRDRSHPAHDRLIVNPHAAFYSEEGLLDMRVKGSEACRRALTGQTLRNVVN